MTIIDKSEERVKNGRTFVIERYREKGFATPMWRYFEVENGVCYKIADMLFTKPNINRLKL